ncbi:MAG: DUF2155 domain-containing protein [Alphaproteobacteria bacterium]|nr:DUF2155 domain-containing protein [Alphaproteobacteria bacterium]
MRNALFIILAFLLSPTLAIAQALSVEGSVAVLQTLDKVTGRVRSLEAPVGQEVEFGPLTIRVRACRKRPPEDPPESAAYLEISERKSAATVNDIFKGWMFASSPAVSALEHPVYDVWVIDCKTARTSAPVSK